MNEQCESYEDLQLCLTLNPNKFMITHAMERFAEIYHQCELKKNNKHNVSHSIFSNHFKNK